MTLHDSAQAMKQDSGNPDESGSSSERYFCPYPNCKRSFAELWRLKVHYRAPPDIRGSGKERGHGTELTHCPKCGKGLKPGKHHVGCSGGKAGPRANKRSRLANASAGMSMDAMPTSMYNLQLQYSQAANVPNGFAPQLGPGYQQQQQHQQYLTAQQYQPDMSAGMYGGQVGAAQNMAGSLPQQTTQLQQQPQQQQTQSPALSMGITPDQLPNGATMVGTTADLGLSSSAPQGYYAQPQQPQQGMQPQMSLDSAGLSSVQSMQGLQTPQLQDNMGAHTAPPFGMTASAAFLSQQQQQQAQAQMQPQPQPLADASMYTTAVDVTAPSTAGMMLPPAQVQVAPGAQTTQQQQQAVLQMQQQQQQPPPQPMAAVVSSATMPPPSQLQPGPGQLSTSGGEVLLQQQTQQQLVAGMVTAAPVVQQQQLLSPAATQQQQQQVLGSAASNASTMSGMPAAAVVLQQVPSGAGVHAGTGLPQQVMQQHQPLQQQVQQQVQAPVMQQQQQAPAPMQTQISSNLFDEIDGVDIIRAPSPPPLPADFPAAPATLFNFAQFSQKLPAAAPPSQQMAMMPRGMEQELPPSLDELWTPEATYDHHSDGDLMQLLFGAPEQPPTMATIHLHHFLDDDACSSPGLLAGILGGSMDDLNAAVKDVAAAAGAEGQVKGDGSTSAAMMAPPLPLQQQQVSSAADVVAVQQPLQQAQPQQQAEAVAFVPTCVEAEQQQQQQQQQSYQSLHQGSVQQLHHQAPMLQSYQQQQHQVYNGTVPVPLNGLNGLNGMNGLHGVNGMNCLAPGAAALPSTGQCASAALQVHMSLQLNVQQQDLATGAAAGGGLVSIKGEEDALLVQQKAAVAALPGAMASRAN